MEWWFNKIIKQSLFGKADWRATHREVTVVLFRVRKKKV